METAGFLMARLIFNKLNYGYPVLYLLKPFLSLFDRMAAFQDYTLSIKWLILFTMQSLEMYATHVIHVLTPNFKLKLL